MDEITYTPRVRRSGGSLVVVIPIHIVEKMEIKKDDLVEIKMKKLG